eukprot:4224903-Pleurochrysis_carterae.AAC.1
MQDTHLFASRTGDAVALPNRRVGQGEIRELANFLDVLLFGFRRSIGLLAAPFKTCTPGGNHPSSVVGVKSGTDTLATKGGRAGDKKRREQLLLASSSSTVGTFRLLASASTPTSVCMIPANCCARKSSS